MEWLIRTQGLSKSFARIRALDAVTLDILEGEMFGIVGPDGAGKTTLLRILCGILTPTSGDANVLGLNILHDADAIKSQIGYLSQKFSLYGDLTVDENIEFFAGINSVSDFAKRRNELLEFTRLTSFRTRLAEKLSGGMKQKLALACTLIHTPRILLLDEPTTGVDPVSRRDFWRILQNLNAQGMTIVMTTPYLDEAERCARVTLMHEGRLMVTGTPTEVKGMMKETILEVVCQPAKSASRVLKPVSGIEVQAFGDRLHVVFEPQRRSVEEIISMLGSAGIQVTQWREVSPSLENVFISLLTRNDSRHELQSN